jgi:pimeloyl-ACP methyl ester carboxylesterase
MRDPLVLLPGMICDARVFGAQITAFSTALTITVAPVTGGDRIEEIASRLLDVLPRRFALAGHSMGAVVAMELLRRAPDRISRIALMSTHSLAETPQMAADMEPVIIKLKSGRLEEAVNALVRPESLAPGPGRAAVAAQLLEMARTVGAEGIIRQVRAMQRRRDYQAVLRKAKLPTLVLCGAHDSLTPMKRHELMAGLIEGARLEVLEGAGHLPLLEQPDAVNAALFDWMQQPAGVRPRADV